MSGFLNSTNPDDQKPDLLAHKYRPRCSDKFHCNTIQALRLKQWIQEYMSLSTKTNTISDHDDSSFGSDCSERIEIVRKCVLLTGPPGVGKTSLVYTIANELNLHVVETHPSEKRDSKLFSMLKLTNQKGKINTIAKLFQAAKMQHNDTRRKRRKLSETLDDNKQTSKPSLSLSGDTSIVLFDDIDVVFEEDGPFFKSLVEFIKESKRPVVLTATKTIDYIKGILINYEHIHLDKPIVEECSSLLSIICKQEKYKRLSNLSRCQIIANRFNCDIRKCLNGIHFYGDRADEHIATNFNHDQIVPNFRNLKLDQIEENKTLLNSYASASLVDIMETKLNLIDQATLFERWLDGRPSIRNEEHGFDQDLGEQIRDSILGLTKSLSKNELITDADLLDNEETNRNLRAKFIESSWIINERIQSRIEPPDKEFLIDIVPSLSEIVNHEAQNKAKCQTKGFSSRRSRRVLSYLDTINVYFESSEIDLIAKVKLKPEDLI